MAEIFYFLHVIDIAFEHFLCSGMSGGNFYCFGKGNEILDVDIGTSFRFERLDIFSNQNFSGIGFFQINFSSKTEEFLIEFFNRAMTLSEVIKLVVPFALFEFSVVIGQKIWTKLVFYGGCVFIFLVLACPMGEG